jgi:hypothetical protein
MSSPTSGIGKSATARTVGRDARRARAIARATEVAPHCRRDTGGRSNLTTWHRKGPQYARYSNSDRTWHMGSAAGPPRARAAQVFRRSGTDHRCRWSLVAWPTRDCAIHAVSGVISSTSRTIARRTFGSSIHDPEVSRKRCLGPSA